MGLRRKTRLRSKRGLERKTPLRSTSRLSRGKGLNPVNTERREKRYEQDFGEKADLIRDQPCDTCGAPPPNDPSHFPSRGAGGTKEDTFPQCRSCHRTMGQKGVDTFLRSLDPPRDRLWLSERTEHWERRWRERELA